MLKLLLTRYKEVYSPTHDSPVTVMEKPSDYKNKPDSLLKRIPLHRLMDLKIDYAFKQLFGNDKNKDIMVVFLNAILQRTNRKQIRDITFLNIEAGGEYVDDKQSRLDLLVVTDDGERINVEIQFTNKYNMIKRSLYYWSGIYRSPLKKRMSYEELSTVISINILNFSLFDQTEQFHTTYHLYEDEERFKLTDVMEFHFIEMTKLIKAWKEGALDPWNDVLARWLLLLGIVDHRNNQVYEDIYRELEEIAMKDETLKNAFQTWEELSMTPEEFLAYESRLKRILDEEAAQREMELRKQEIELQKQEIERVKNEIEQTKHEIEQVKYETEQTKYEVNRMKQEVEQREHRLKQRSMEADRKIKEAKDTSIKIAQKLLSTGMSVDQAVELTELSNHEVTEIKKRLKRD